MSQRNFGSSGRKGGHQKPVGPSPSWDLVKSYLFWCPRIWPGVSPWSLHDPMPSCILCPKSGLGLQPDSAFPSWTALLLACAVVDACGEYGQEDLGILPPTVTSRAALGCFYVKFFHLPSTPFSVWLLFGLCVHIFGVLVLFNDRIEEFYCLPFFCNF